MRCVMSAELKFVETFAKTLKKLMQERGVSAAVVCSATSIPKSSLSEWLAGRQPKMDESIIRLAKFFGVSVEFLICGKHPEETLVKGLLEDLEDGFVSIHRGVYRINVEKYAKTPLKKKGGDE